MRNQKLRLITATFFAAATFPATAANPVILPARVLTPTEAAALPSAPGVTTLSVTLKTAAYVNTTRLGVAQPASVARGNGTTSSVYFGTDGTNGPPAQAPQPAPPVPIANQLYNFKQSGDAVQAWAAMTASGQPFIFLSGFGSFAADGHASWRTALPLPSGLHKVYLRVTVPAVTVFGNYEENAPGRYRSRARADVLVNGHSVYFGEAVRINETDPIPSSVSACTFTSQELAVHLLSYGQSLGFSGPADTGAGTPQPPSQSQTVVLYLGTFDSSELLDVQFVLNADAAIENPCCQKPPMGNVKGEIFCSSSLARFEFQNNAAPTFYVQ